MPQYQCSFSPLTLPCSNNVSESPPSGCELLGKRVTFLTPKEIDSISPSQSSEPFRCSWGGHAVQGGCSPWRVAAAPPDGTANLEPVQGGGVEPGVSQG